jgi:DNA-binding beta-propeller fold protein YncE
MKKLLFAALVAAVTAFSNTGLLAHDFGPLWLGTQRFAILPDGVRYPEGITANPDTGDIYTATFDFGATVTQPNKLLRFDHSGHLVASRDLTGPALGLGFRNGKVYLLAFGSGEVLRIAADFNSTTAFELVGTVPKIGAPGPRSVGNPDGSSDTITFGFSGGAAAPNAMVFDNAGNLYISDSFQGAIFRIDAAASCSIPCTVKTVLQHPLLATAGFPPFGANGLALDAAEAFLYVANTGDSRVLKVDLAAVATTPGTAVTVFAESIHGADGLLVDSAGRLWVAANQKDELVALNTSGRVIIRAGDFLGIRGDGTPRGLLFPASMVIVGDFMYVTNLALPLTDAAGDEPEEDVTRWTISRIRIPRHH